MTVAQFQKIQELTEGITDDVELLAFTVCVAFDKTVEQVDNMSRKEFMKYVNRLTKELNPKEDNEIQFTTDASAITFGQFIECQHWMKTNWKGSLSLIAASILVNRSDHKQDVIWINSLPLSKVLHHVTKFNQSMVELVKSYSGLFEIDETDEDVEKDKQHHFIERYGWIYSATQVAAHEGIVLDKVYDLPIIQALNDMSYLKSEQKYDEYLSKN